MPICGLYFKREVKVLQEIARTYAHKEAIVEKQREINKLKDENELKIRKIEEIYAKVYEDMLLEQVDIERKLKCKKNEVYVLRSILELESDKKIKRLEYIIKRTKKARVRKTCENKIIDYMMRKIAYESK